MVRVVVMHVMMFRVVMVFRGKGRGGKHHEEQRSSKEPFHGSNVARLAGQRGGCGIKTGTGVRAEAAPGVHWRHNERTGCFPATESQAVLF